LNSVNNPLNPNRLKKLVKPLVLITIAAFISATSYSQLKLPVVNGIAPDIKKVIEDYPNQFTNITGEIITENNQSTDYQCLQKVTGAEENFITRHSAKKETASFQAIMLTTESFSKAKQKFKSLYSQLNNITVTLNNTAYKLKGDYTTPAEEAKFTSVLFSAEPEQEDIKKLKTELILQFYPPMEWKVKILVYDKEREDNERGKQKEE
jgi:hypothetical protein